MSTRSRIKFAILTFLLLAGFLTAFRYQLRIGAWYWHVRHGFELSVGNYVIPVPAGWAVESLVDGKQLLLRVETSDLSAIKRIKAHASILLIPGSPIKEQDVDRVLSLEAASRAQAADFLSRRTIGVDGDTLSCVRLDQPLSPQIYDLVPAAWSCILPGGLRLSITATEPDIDQTWNIVSRIRKRSS